MPNLTIRRLYYTVRDVREIAKISSQTLRLWEEKFPVLHPAKSKAGRRLFKQNDLDTILCIKKLKDAGYKDTKILELLQNAETHFNIDDVIERKHKTEKRKFMHEIFHDLEEILKILDEN
jgi:DNA-binding transcriptional MerR regulator